MVGTNSTKLQEKMLHDKHLTLQSAISLCTSAETTRRQMQVLQEKGGALHGNGGTAPVNVIKRDRKRITQKQMYVAPPGETSNCENCGFKHIPKRCPAYNAICHNCKLKGHYRKQCTKAVNVVNVEPNVFCGVVKTAEKCVKIRVVSDQK